MPMSSLELEIYHQMRDGIGIDPAFYEYIFMVDADTIYEYTSHYLAKPFESLFGSVTCLHGCFFMYRIRTADKYCPIIISNRIIDYYSEDVVDTLHKKNLLSLGEGRYLTTLIMNHFLMFKMKLHRTRSRIQLPPIGGASCFLNVIDDQPGCAQSNPCEFVILPELCGLCCFSIRGMVFLGSGGTAVSGRWYLKVCS
ncbi:hypothetical protein FRC12_014101 [Ceratobasidium sp. 428]|nr:hypothetical protein FRC12_014101 [Ceratobasidium sp. 428]